MSEEQEFLLNIEDMRLEEVSVSELKPHPMNPRIDLVPGMPLYDKLKDSILHHKYVDPIIWNRTSGHILAGHQRLRVIKDIAEEEGKSIDKIKVVVVEMDESEETTFLIADNKITGLWDNEKLAKLFEELDDEVQRYTGFDDFEIATLLGQSEEDMNFDDGDMSDYEDNAEGQLKAYNVILSCKSDEEQEFVKTLIRENAKLRRTYKVEDLIERFNADGEQGN